METRAPTFGQIAVAIGFALSCFGLLLFLWTTFGGPIPLKPKGYRIKVPVNEGTQLAKESDVRISNVSVGKVKDIQLGDGDRRGGDDRDRRQVRADPRGHAGDPAPEDAARRDLRRAHAREQGRAEACPRTASCRQAQVADSVQLDEIFRTFDPKTRAAFQTWMQGAAEATQRPRRRHLGRDRATSSRSPRTPTASCACSTPRASRPSSSSATPASSSTRSPSARASSAG